MAKTNTGHIVTVHLFSFLGRHIRHRITYYFDRLQNIFKTFSEWYFFLALEGELLMLKKSQVQNIDNEMSEQNDMVFVVNVKSFAERYFVDIELG